MRSILRIIKDPVSISSSVILVPHFSIKYTGRKILPIHIDDTECQLKRALASTLDQAIMMGIGRTDYASYGASVNPRTGTVNLYAMAQTKDPVNWNVMLLYFPVSYQPL